MAEKALTAVIQEAYVALLQTLALDLQAKVDRRFGLAVFPCSPRVYRLYGPICYLFDDRALDGDVQAIKEILDRVDGRVPQAIVGDDEHDPVRVTEIRRIIVDPDCREPLRSGP